MVRPSENWERRVRAMLRREKLRHDGRGGQERAPSGIAGSVLPSLTRETNIDLILEPPKRFSPRTPMRPNPLRPGRPSDDAWRIMAVRLCASLFTADFGQGTIELEGLEQKDKASGASQLVVKDLKEEFVRDYIFPCLRAGAVYERKYLLGISMARPVIAKGHG